jgi:lysophospholipase L1-like esterase
MANKMNTQRKGWTLLWVSAGLNVVTIIIIILMVVHDKEEYYQKYIRKRVAADMVMFGDSHTDGAPWNSLIHHGLVLRKGFSGYTTVQLAGMISRTIKYHPKYVFIQGGGNDVRSRCFSMDFTISNFKFMADTLRLHNITPVFQRLFYRHNNPVFNRMADSINLMLGRLCEAENIDFIDIGAQMHDSTGLRADLCTDDIHLNEKGYKLWAKVVNDYLESKGGL